MTPATVDRTQELAVFLRTRRERLDPDDLGLPSRRQTRRTPGLRREEVGELAGISVDYIVRLEQARGLRPSADVVEALARLVADLSPLPALLMNHRYDILTWNSEMARLLLDFDALPPSQRNVMWLCLLYPEMREFYVDRERVVREGIAHLRAAWAAHPEDQALTDLIAECIAGDEDFARLWAERDVKVNGRGSKVIRHPDFGSISVQYETLTPLQGPDQLLVIYRATDSQSQSALDRLSAR